MSSDLRRTLGHTTVYMVGLVLNRGVAFLLVPIFTRVLSTESFSIWDYCQTMLLLLFPMLDFGMSSAVIRFYHDYSDRNDRMRAFNTSLLFIICLHVFLLGLGFILASPLARLLFQDEGKASLVRLVFLMASATAIGKQSLSLLRTAERSVIFATLNLVRGALGPLFIIILVVGLRFDVAGALWGDLIGLIFLALAGMWVCRDWLRWQFNWGMLREMLAFALPLVPMGLGVTVLTGADRFFLGRMYDMTVMAPYSLGFRVGMLMLLFVQALQLAWPPAAMRMATQPDGPKAITRIGYLIQVMLFSGAVVISGCVPELIRIFAPQQQYAAARLVIPWIACAYAIHGAIQVVNAGIGISKRTIWATWATLSACIFKLAISYWFIKEWGILGAAVSTLFAFIFELAITYAITQYRVYPLPHDKGRIMALYGLSLSAVGAFQCTLLLPYFISLPIRLVILSAFGIIAYFGLIPAEDRQGLWRYINVRIKRRTT